MEEAAIDEDEDEEEKMEKFFALIKSTREVRECLVGATKSKERADADKPQWSPWKPTFVLEDFMEAPPEVEKEGSSTEGEKEESGEKNGLELDLTLSL